MNALIIRGVSGRETIAISLLVFISYFRCLFFFTFPPTASRWLPVEIKAVWRSHEHSRLSSQQLAPSLAQ